jgi:hypothetical protein
MTYYLLTEYVAFFTDDGATRTYRSYLVTERTFTDTPVTEDLVDRLATAGVRVVGIFLVRDEAMAMARQMEGYV